MPDVIIMCGVQLERRISACPASEYFRFYGCGRSICGCEARLIVMHPGPITGRPKFLGGPRVRKGGDLNPWNNGFAGRLAVWNGVLSGEKAMAALLIKTGT